MRKKIVSVLLVAALLLTSFSVPAFANEDVTDRNTQKVYTVLDKVVNSLVSGIAALIKTPSWGKKADYETSEFFFKGNSAEDFASDDEGQWMIGYSNASLLTGKEVGSDGEYYVGGSLSVSKKLATEQWDDQKVRTVAISTGDGINIFVALDCYGIANTEVKKIREKFVSYAEENDININTINVSALHQHSCVDTFGLNGDIVNALFTSSIRNMLGLELPSGKNPDYMNHLYEATFTTMKEAVDNMQTGSLYFGTVDASDFIRDKRDPQVFDGNLNRFRFVPEEGGTETWIVNAGIHCVGNGAGHTELTGDYPYYMEQYINENDNANLFYIEGAELAITSKGDSLELDSEKLEAEGNKYEIKVYGETLAAKLETISNETPVSAKFNIAFREVWIDIDNPILVLAAKGGLLDDNIYKNGIGKYAIVTEVGYAQFGDDIAVAVIPGELAPEIAFGGGETSETSWDGEDWEYSSIESLSEGRKLLVFGITNDQVGYILPSNNWHSIFTENEEVVSCGKYTGVSITEGYIELLKELNITD